MNRENVNWEEVWRRQKLRRMCIQLGCAVPCGATIQKRNGTISITCPNCNQTFWINPILLKKRKKK